MESSAVKEESHHSEEGSFDTSLEDCSTRERKMNTNFIKKFIEHVEKSGITCNQIKPFCNLLISFSKKGSKPKYLPDHKKVNKKDICNLLEHLFEKIEQKDSINKRPFKRINYKLSYVLFTYVAIDNPEVMHQIANNYFADFTFNFKLNNKVELSSQWNQYVDDIQNIIKSSITVNSTMTDINSDIEDESHFPDEILPNYDQNNDFDFENYQYFGNSF